MKQILKIATLLLVLLAMAGMASAAGTIALDSIEQNSTHTTNYDLFFTMTGIDDTDINAAGTEVNFNSTLLTSTDYSAVGNKLTLFNVSLLNDTVYPLTLSDSAAVSLLTTSPFDFRFYNVSAIILDFKSTSDSTANNTTPPTGFYNITWTTGSDVEVFNGTWNSITSPGNIDVNVSSPSSLTYRIHDDSPLIMSQNITVQFENFTTTISNVNDSNSVNWTVSGVDFTDSTLFYIWDVTANDKVPAANITGDASGWVNASGLTPGQTYTLFIRSNNTATGYGPYTANPVTLAAVAPVDLIDWANTTTTPADWIDKTDKKAITPKTLENSTLLKLYVPTLVNSDFKWELNSSVTGFTNISRSNVTNSVNDTFEWTPDKLGTYKLNLTVTETGNASNTTTLSWDITVTEKSSGKRIWSDGMPTTYEWNARSFAGFYYNLDTGEGSEKMTITNIGRSLDRNSITYTTKTSNVTFAYDPWGDYQIVGFMGDKYYAGSGSGSGSGNDSLMKNGNLSKVLVDSDNSTNYRVGQYIALEEGYSIRIDQISVNGNQAFLIIEKDGKEVASGVVNADRNGTFIYEKDLGKTKVPLIRIHVSNVFMGTESSLLTIDGLFQISDKLTKLESGTKIDKMEITSVSGDTIEMTNSDRISLNQGSDITLMGKMKFIVADNSTLKFAPTIEYTDPGIYEIRGTVSDFNNSNDVVYEWTPQNFEGFYYNIDDDISSSESIKINQTLSDSNRRIDKGNLTYEAKVTTLNYSYSSWGNYAVVGFMGEKYYAGTGGSLLKGGNLSKVLIDGDESRHMRVGQYITLEEGFAVRITDINVGGDATFFTLEKNGTKVDEGVVRSGNDYVYKKKVGNGSGTDVEFIKIHVDSVFMGTESSIVSISGLFQASENLTRLESGAKYGKMEVNSFSSSGIELSNSESISLSSGNNVEFMKVGNQSMYFKVGDNSTLRFAPVVEREIGSTTPLEVTVEPSEVEVGSKVNVTVMDRGTTIEGVTVSANGTVVGTTNSSGMIEYTTNSVGTIKISGEKPGYVNGSASLTVKEKSLNMTISVSPDPLYFGTSGTVKVTDALNGSAVSGVSILVGNASAGTTGSNGELTYTFNTTGNVTIQGSKTGYINATKSVFITQKDVFNYSNFTMKPDPLAAKSNTKLTFEAVNIGIEEGSHTLKLVVKDSDGTVISETTNDISLKVGASKKTTFSFKPPAEGNYRLELTETDSDRVIDLPSSMSSISVGPKKMFGSTILYIILAILAIILLVIIGFVAYLFGVKGATRHNYKDVAGNIVDDVKMRFRR